MMDSDAISPRSGTSIADTCGGTTSQERMSVMKPDFFSWKPTSTPPFLGTLRTEKRARYR